MTVKNTYPLPLIPDSLNKVSEAKVEYFTKLDVRWGYKGPFSIQKLSQTPKIISTLRGLKVGMIFGGSGDFLAPNSPNF